MARASSTTRCPSARASSSRPSPGSRTSRSTTPDSVEVDYERDLGYPGVYPFTRGVYPSMYRGQLWTMRQFAGFGTAEETNERFRYLLEHGQTGPLDRVRHADADGLRLRPRALARRGRPRGRRDRLARRHGDALRRHPARRGLDVDDDQLAGGDAARVLPLRRRAAGRAARGAARDDPDGHPQGVHRAEGVDLPARAVDAARGGHDRVLRAGDAAAGIRSRSPATTSARPARTPSQELAFTLADGFAYVEACVERGLDVDDFAPRLSFFFNAHLDFFEEIAKYRAARRIWARELRERYGAKNPRSWLMRFHTQTAGVSLTAQQPEVNIVRTALEALAAVLGGTQSLHTNSFDEALALPTEDAVRHRAAHAAGDRARDRRRQHDRPARRLVLRRGADEPARGARRTSTSTRIEQLGGVVAGDQGELLPARDRRGVVPLPVRGRGEAAGHRRRQPLPARRTSRRSRSCAIDPALEGKQIERVQALRARRDSAAVEAALARLKEAAAGEANLMPLIVDAVARLRDDGRDVRRAPRGLGHLARNARLLDLSRLLWSTQPQLVQQLRNAAPSTSSMPTWTRHQLSAGPDGSRRWVAGGRARGGRRGRSSSSCRTPAARTRRRTPPVAATPRSRRRSRSRSSEGPAGRTARRGRFILTAVQRKNLDQAWPLAGPQVRQGMSLQGVAEAATSPSAVPRRHQERADEGRLRDEERGAARGRSWPAEEAGKAYKPAIFYVKLNKSAGQDGHWVVNGLPARRIPIPATRTTSGRAVEHVLRRGAGARMLSSPRRRRRLGCGACCWPPPRSSRLAVIVLPERQRPRRCRRRRPASRRWSPRRRRPCSTKAERQAARIAAAKFVSTAVLRKHVDDSWELTAPELQRGLHARDVGTGADPRRPVPGRPARRCASVRTTRSRPRGPQVSSCRPKRRSKASRLRDGARARGPGREPPLARRLLGTVWPGATARRARDQAKAARARARRSRSRRAGCSLPVVGCFRHVCSALPIVLRARPLRHRRAERAYRAASSSAQTSSTSPS